MACERGDNDATTAKCICSEGIISQQKEEEKRTLIHHVLKLEYNIKKVLR
jgi:hypothetical protein